MGKLFSNATFIPLTSEEDRASALLVDDNGRIAYVGTSTEARALDPEAKLIDLGGAAVLPGFIDPHSHFTGALQYLLYADLGSCNSFADIADTLRDFAEQHNIGPEGVIMGTNYDQGLLAEGRHPDRALLDEVSHDVPILITHVSNHMGVANSCLLELAGIDGLTPDPEGGRFGREEDGVTPNGYAEEPAAMNRFYAVTTPRLNLDFAAMAPAMQRVYLEHGITTCQDGATGAAMAAMLCNLADAGAWQIDIVGYPMWGEDTDAILADHPAFDGPEYRGHFRFGGLKMFLDGSPQGLTAWMTEPYTRGPEGEADWCAYGTMTDAEALAFARKAVDAGRQLLCHTNGDAAADQLLRVYQQALEESPNPQARTLRPTMIHCQTVRTDQYEQMAKIAMIPSIFASHVWYWGDAHLRNFGSERGGRISACGDAKRAGLPFTLHTDTPVLRPNLLESVWCAVNRVTRSGVQLNESQKVSVFDGLCAITKNAAYQYGEEHLKGTLEPGKLADLVILDRDPLAVDPGSLREIVVEAVLKEGQLVYQREE